MLRTRLIDDARDPDSPEMVVQPPPAPRHRGPPVLAATRNGEPRQQMTRNTLEHARMLSNALLAAEDRARRLETLYRSSVARHEHDQFWLRFDDTFGAGTIRQAQLQRSAYRRFERDEELRDRLHVLRSARRHLEREMTGAPPPNDEVVLPVKAVMSTALGAMHAYTAQEAVMSTALGATHAYTTPRAARTAPPAPRTPRRQAPTIRRNLAWTSPRSERVHRAPPDQPRVLSPNEWAYQNGDPRYSP